MELDIYVQSELISTISALIANKPWYENAIIIALTSGSLAILGGAISSFVNLRSEEQRNKAELNKVTIEFEIAERKKFTTISSKH